jgi:predicted component of type VI protein secretion system
MFKLVVLLVAVPAMLVPVACSTCDPDEKVSILVETGTDLNTYLEGGRVGAHSLDLYVFKVDDPNSFLANEPSRLRVTDQGVVPGGQSIARYEIQPGETPLLDLGVMGTDRWTAVGIYAAFGSPANTGEAVKAVLELPGDCGYALKLSSNSIVSFID